jgi:pyridoxine 5-phosphate synthase
MIGFELFGLQLLWSEHSRIRFDDGKDSLGLRVPLMIPRLGVNVDHIATLRQLRGTPYPSVLEAAKLAERAGAKQITVHLREDRRHIQEADVKLLRKELRVALNLEMAVTPQMIRFAVKLAPTWVCLVPEKRNEVTTEGGLAIEKQKKKIASAIQTLKAAGIRVSLFVEPTTAAVKLSHDLGADAVELHTGQFCMATQGALGASSKKRVQPELDRIRKACLMGKKLGIHVHAGHGLDYENVRMLTELVGDDNQVLIAEYNIGHSIVCRAAIVGFERATREMLSAIVAP